MADLAEAAALEQLLNQVCCLIPCLACIVDQSHFWLLSTSAAGPSHT